MAIVLLTVVTLAYAGYNLFVKVSGDHMPETATSTVLATYCLQMGAMASTTVFLAFLTLQGGHSLRLSGSAYGWAVVAGLCIGIAEVCYFYIFGGVGGIKPLPANLVIPTVVAGTIVITLIVSFFVFKERLNFAKLISTFLTISGAIVLRFGKLLM